MGVAVRAPRYGRAPNDTEEGNAEFQNLPFHIGRHVQSMKWWRVTRLKIPEPRERYAPARHEILRGG